MKTKIVSFLLVVVALASCRPEPFEDPDGSYDLTTGLNGTWTLEALELEDRSFPTFVKRDITDFYGSTELTITFNAADGSYTVNGPQEGHPFGSSGFFSFDNPDYPTQMTVSPSDAGIGNTTLDLGNMIRPIDPSMILINERESCEQVYAQYIYTFNRKN